MLLISLYLECARKIMNKFDKEEFVDFSYENIVKSLFFSF